MQRKFSENQNCAKRTGSRTAFFCEPQAITEIRSTTSAAGSSGEKFEFAKTRLPEKYSYFQFVFAKSNENAVKIETVRNARAHERLFFSRDQPKSKPKV